MLVYLPWVTDRRWKNIAGQSCYGRMRSLLGRLLFLILLFYSSHWSFSFQHPHPHRLAIHFTHHDSGQKAKEVDDTHGRMHRSSPAPPPPFIRIEPRLSKKSSKRTFHLKETVIFPYYRRNGKGKEKTAYEEKKQKSKKKAKDYFTQPGFVNEPASTN